MRLIGTLSVKGDRGTLDNQRETPPDKLEASRPKGLKAILDDQGENLRTSRRHLRGGVAPGSNLTGRLQTGAASPVLVGGLGLGEGRNDGWPKGRFDVP
jgi:hypothetical protein